ncbi:MAG TPA: substrate-binding domain-containing protein [Candidatus Bathyarchaeia archaeon]
MSKEQISRRKYLKYAAAGAVAAGAVAVGGAYYLTRPAPTAAGEFKHGGSVMYLTPMVGDFFFVACKEYLKRAVEADGWKFAFDSSDWSDATQTDQLVTYADQYDIIFVFPTSLEGINEGIRIAEVEKHTPVVVQKNFVIGEYGRFVISFDDFGVGKRQAEMAVDFIKQKYGTAEGKKVVAFSGSYAASGWRNRALGFKAGIAQFPEVDWEEWECGGDPAGWGNQADLYFSTDTADAIVAASAGSYFRGIMDALDRYGKLYYVGDPKHIYTTTIDGKPSELQWIRRGYMDDSFSQSPDALMPIGWNLARDYLLKNADYQKSPYTMPSIPTPLEVGAPPGAYWGEGDPKMTIDKGLIYPEVSMPQGVSPVYSVNKDNVNNPDIWGNTYTFWKGKEDIQMLTWPAKGTPPAWSQQLLDDYETMFNKYF